MKLPMKATLLGVSVLVLVLCVLSIWLYVEVQNKVEPAKSVEIFIPRGASSLKIAEKLAQAEVISSASVFRLYVRLSNHAAHLRSGYYRFDKPASIKQIVDRLVAGDVMPFQVTIPEGLRTDEVLVLLASQTSVPVPTWQASLKQLLPEGDEGRLLPETYQYTKPLDAKRLLHSMIRAQDKILDGLAASDVQRKRLRIMASIIEKETALPEERPIVAAVIRNRLERHMPLQMDPTVIYGIWKTKGAFSGNIRRKDLLRDTPWNTYTRRGLPPTPIGNPGAGSLQAAAHPADSSALYFVADGKGGHMFADTLAEHQANVRQWVRIEKQQNRIREKKAHAR